MRMSMMREKGTERKEKTKRSMREKVTRVRAMRELLREEVLEA